MRAAARRNMSWMSLRLVSMEPDAATQILHARPR